MDGVRFSALTVYKQMARPVQPVGDKESRCDGMQTVRLTPIKHVTNGVILLLCFPTGKQPCSKQLGVQNVLYFY